MNGNRRWIMLLFVLLVICSVCILCRNKTGETVVVTVDGAVYGNYDLYTDREVVIGPADKSWHNTLVIAAGEAYISEADCDNQVCVHTPSLRQGEIGVIVCLPHGVAVELKD